ncbi:MAG: hypothetical protein HY677_01335 [Chloroflexi bacterium]|nr:hypothetical protein [Chloroflexota bacterium]
MAGDESAREGITGGVREALDALLDRAIDAVQVLRKRNVELEQALAEANKKLSYYEDLSGNALTSLEESFQRQAKDLEETRGRLASLQETFGKAFREVRSQSQQLVESLEAANKRLSFYERLLDVRTLAAAESSPSGAEEGARSDSEISDQEEEGRLEGERRAADELNQEALRPISVPVTSRWPSNDGAPADGWGYNRMEIIVSPFSHFDTIARFLNAVRALPGLSELRSQSFQKGVLHLAAVYSGDIPLSACLRELPDWQVRVIEDSPGRIEAVVESLGTRVGGSGAG